MTTPAGSAGGALRGAFAALGRHRGDLAASIAYHIVERALWLAIPLLATRVVTRAAAAGAVPLDALALTVGAIAALAAARQLGAFHGIRAQERAIRAVRASLLRAALWLPLGVAVRRRPGELAHILADGGERLVHFAADLTREVVPIAVTMIGGALLLARIDPSLALAVLPGTALVVGASRLLGRRIRPTLARAAHATSHLHGFVKETLVLAPALRAVAVEDAHLRRHDQLLDEQLAARLRGQRAHSWFGALALLIGALALVAVTVLGTARLAAGELAPFALVEAMMYALLLMSPMVALADLHAGGNAARVIAAQLDELLGEPSQDPDAGDALPPGRGALAIDGLSFAYPGRGAVLRDVSLRVAPGTTAALVGPNGAGKTTLLRLLLRLLEPTAGSIALDGAPIATVRPAAVRRAIGVVLQGDVLAHGTVRDNLVFGRDVDDDAVARALAASGLADMLTGLPDGLDTEVGAGGTALSGGQRTAVQLARALVGGPRLLLLDEPTSMLDDEARARVVAAIAALRGTVTIVVATHDPAVVALADTVHPLAPARAAGA